MCPQQHEICRRTQRPSREQKIKNKRRTPEISDEADDYCAYY